MSFFLLQFKKVDISRSVKESKQRKGEKRKNKRRVPQFYEFSTVLSSNVLISPKEQNRERKEVDKLPKCSFTLSYCISVSILLTKIVWERTNTTHKIYLCVFELQCPIQVIISLSSTLSFRYSGWLTKNHCNVITMMMMIIIIFTIVV